jgi:hypothetical protein
VHDVGADLATEGDLHLARFHGIQLGALLLQLEVIQPRLQHLHGDFPVADLAALVLAGDNESTRKVGDADRGIGHVDVLSSRPAGAVGVDAEILVLDLDLDVVVDLRPREHGREGRVPPGRRVERADPHQAVHSHLG